MLTTLTQRDLSSFTLKYKFLNRKLSLYIDVPAGHELFGDVNIELSNCQSINIYNSLGILVEDVFNDTFLFKAISSTRLEYSIGCNSGLPESVAEVAVSDNESSAGGKVSGIALSGIDTDANTAISTTASQGGLNGLFTIYNPASAINKQAKWDIMYRTVLGYLSTHFNICINESCPCF